MYLKTLINFNRSAAERLLAAQNPLSQANRPHQLFSDAPVIEVSSGPGIQHKLPPLPPGPARMLLIPPPPPGVHHAAISHKTSNISQAIRIGPVPPVNRFGPPALRARFVPPPPPPRPGFSLSCDPRRLPPPPSWIPSRGLGDIPRPPRGYPPPPPWLKSERPPIRPSMLFNVRPPMPPGPPPS